MNTAISPVKMLLAGLAALALAATAQATPPQQVLKHWTPQRLADAVPRDLRIDSRGQGYLRGPDGRLQPYGQSVRNDQLQQGKPDSGSQDTTPPSITWMDPAEGSSIATSYTFSANVIDDASGIKSVSFLLTYPSGQQQSFSPSFVGNDTWQTTLQGFTNGNWSWQVIAKDGASRGGNTATSAPVHFQVGGGDGGDNGGNDGGSAGYIVSNAPWSDGGTIQTAAGRIYFEMPSNPRRKRWAGYVCSGTVATDGITGRSVIITAAHCVYDDANKAFARNVLFIPNQAGTSGSGTDLNCSNDPLGCWVPSFGVVDNNWTQYSFPDNVEWDYAYYVVSDSGAHSGNGSGEVLDQQAGALPVDFSAPFHDDGNNAASSADFTQGLGYSYSDDPNFMYCAEDMTSEGTVNWWLPSCGLSGGASGGPWRQPNGSNAIISVNSWGYTTAPGMAGPKLSGSSAACLFEVAKSQDFAAVSGTDGDAGLAVDYCTP